MANILDSPRLMRSNVLNHLVESNVGSSREGIEVDLVSKIVYDDPSVFRRLRVNEVDDDLVATCASTLKFLYASDISLLKELAEQASRKSPDALEVEEVGDKRSDNNREEKSGNHGSVEEKRMYDPLVRLFNHVTTFGLTVGPRGFTKTNGMLKADEPHTFGFPSVSPDITLAAGGVGASTSRNWRDRDGFGEVKPSKRQGPKPATAGTIPPIVTQCSDYARLFMSARPFMLFCVGILIFGTEFCVGIFDRDGVTFSPIYDMFDATDVFVRVARSLACELSIGDLGFDPTVRVLTDEETEGLTGQTKYPSAVVSSGGHDPREWCTIGSPIWTSLSFLGRATNVWRVKEYVIGDNKLPCLRGNMMIMKTAWRSSARTSESDIYLSIEQPNPRGLAEFECGGDVRFPGLAGFPITVRNLRGDIYHTLRDDLDPPTPVLHRLILRTVGRPLWDYYSDRDLLTGFRDALEGEFFTAISALVCGFITDLEFARIQGSTLRRRPVITGQHTTFESTVAVKRGAGMTGTTQFMARKILNQQGTRRVVHQATHNVESFVWVLSFCVMRNVQLRAINKVAPADVHAQCKAFRTIFPRAFGRATPDDIADERQSGSRALTFPTDPKVDRIVANFISSPLCELFFDLQILVHAAQAPVSPENLTHDALLVVVDKAISSLPV